MITNERLKTELCTKDFYYELPEELIAQFPAEKRDGSRLLVLDRETGKTEHRHFYDIKEYLRPEDVLVINDSRVIPARLLGNVEGNPEKSIEFLLLKNLSDDKWEALSRPGKRAKIGARFEFGGGELRCDVIDIADEGNRIIRFEYEGRGNFFALLDRCAQTPLPPYIKAAGQDKERYQTVYARENGSSAAPTAGLHFTKHLLSEIQKSGVGVVPVMLHVGLGTFRPVKEKRIEEHVMHGEFITVTQEAADEINRRRADGGRIICVGTTSCRTLESVSDNSGIIHPYSGETGIYIYPPYKFKATDALITNFHLPESTLLMLVSAFAGRENILSAYKTAIEEKYRFFSFGDAMLLI